MGSTAAMVLILAVYIGDKKLKVEVPKLEMNGMVFGFVRTTNLENVLSYL